MILANHGIVSSSGASFDADALAFITAASITDNTQKTAVNTLVTDLKAYNIWTKMKAIYPFIGGTAAQHRFNLKDPRTINAAFYLDFSGGWTHSNTGITGNGTNTYAETKFNPFTSHPFFDIHYSLYSRTDTNSGGDMGGSTSPGYVDEGWLSLRSGGYAFAGFYDNDSTYGGGSIKVLVPDSLGMYVDSAIAKNNQFLQKNNTILGTWTSNSVISVPANTTISIGAIHDATANTYVIPATREYAFASFGFGLTTTEATALTNAVQTFQVALSRNV